ncbi:uncharacterized protein K441DRAFT_128070 [Cenococcum geophilum 1.58]|uniref:uncharacterized protein n=1 Tax=Cenococcum geophilum 1.58 TaxID=794803 RepID=UPI00358F1502|nr:hypothetical protein K441DRAFT_128070 [Cenococcum geophilum 1.58]
MGDPRLTSSGFILAARTRTSSAAWQALSSDLFLNRDTSCRPNLICIYIYTNNWSSFTFLLLTPPNISWRKENIHTSVCGPIEELAHPQTIST